MRLAGEAARPIHCNRNPMTASCSCDVPGRAARPLHLRRARRLRALAAFSGSTSSQAPPKAVIFDLGKAGGRRKPCRRRRPHSRRRRWPPLLPLMLPQLKPFLARPFVVQVLLDFDFHKSSKRLAAACQAPSPTRQVRWGLAHRLASVHTQGGSAWRLHASFHAPALHTLPAGGASGAVWSLATAHWPAGPLGWALAGGADGAGPAQQPRVLRAGLRAVRCSGSSEVWAGTQAP